MVTNYQDTGKISLSSYITFLSFHIKDGLKELFNGSRPFAFSLGYFYRSLSSALKIVTRWTLVLLQLGTILLISGSDAMTSFLTSDILFLTYKLYRTYQPILISLEQSGMSTRTYQLFVELAPWLFIYTFSILILCVVRGIRANQQERLESTPVAPELDMDYDDQSSPTASFGVPLGASNPRVYSARTVEDDRFPRDRNCLHVSYGSQPGLFWCLHPTCSLRGAWLEVKRSADAVWSGATPNGIPLALFKSVGWFIVISADYLIARTQIESIDQEDSDAPNFFLYRFYNYIHGLTGLERRPSQIPSDFDSVVSYQYGSEFDTQSENLHEVVIEP